MYTLRSQYYTPIFICQHQALVHYRMLDIIRVVHIIKTVFASFEISNHPTNHSIFSPYDWQKMITNFKFIIKANP